MVQRSLSISCQRNKRRIAKANFLSAVNVVKFVDANTAYYKWATAIYKTSDGGQTWSLNCKVGSDDLIGMYFLDIHTGWACTSKGRILRIQQ